MMDYSENGNPMHATELVCSTLSTRHGASHKNRADASLWEWTHFLSTILADGSSADCLRQRHPRYSNLCGSEYIAKWINAWCVLICINDNYSFKITTNQRTHWIKSCSNRTKHVVLSASVKLLLLCGHPFNFPSSISLTKTLNYRSVCLWPNNYWNSFIWKIDTR